MADVKRLYIYDMFFNELGNHEYNYTRDVSVTLAAVGLSMEDINKDKKLLYGLNKAINDQRDFESDN